MNFSWACAYNFYYSYSGVNINFLYNYSIFSSFYFSSYF